MNQFRDDLTLLQIKPEIISNSIQLHLSYQTEIQNNTHKHSIQTKSL